MLSSINPVIATVRINIQAVTAYHRDRLFRTNLRLALNLPPLSKGGGLTARHKLLLCCFLLAICPPLLYCKLFCRQDGRIAASNLVIPTTLSKAPPPLRPNQPSQNRTIPRKALSHSWLMNALLALRLCNRGRLLSVRHCLVSLLCRCIVQRLSVTDFMHPCIPTLFDHLYASLHRAFGRSTSGIHARPLPKVSFCC